MYVISQLVRCDACGELLDEHTRLPIGGAEPCSSCGSSTRRCIPHRCIELITDPESGTVVHGQEEPLSQYRGQGSAKK
jgi:hypothetical protein